MSKFNFRALALLGLALLALLIILPSGAMAQGEEDNEVKSPRLGSHGHQAPPTEESPDIATWPAGMQAMLGIEIENPPEPGSMVEEVEGVVVDPSKLTKLRLTVEKGDKIQLINKGHGMWKVIHVPTGRSGTLVRFHSSPKTSD